ncbi:unnamed protein product [Darwinula stevensoni]|uniref:CUB domain-containing protein n=1 Tax=Darwinula stevensoni TaxID=69355 RepID=A0A7R9A5G5_9CRUS|nr:unnamed protein product [Darwinula stevensoni]CAG0894348.1 unnamed protein product [Darwinula stevensoni]
MQYRISVAKMRFYVLFPLLVLVVQAEEMKAPSSASSQRFFHLFTTQCTTTNTALTAGATATIQSPNYPSNYNNNYYCKWTYTCAKQLTLSCPSIQLQWSLFCYEDALLVWGGSAGYKTLCGSTSLTYTVATGSTLSIVFKTDWWWTANGFQCTVACPA